mmetsp:Transcript_6288/g.19699  ORF Transcript_6288/g.19699 Transcript_6288/m.19699 type:complete len:377 (-) Transcript_6288:204-1334(-)
MASSTCASPTLTRLHTGSTIRTTPSRSSRRRRCVPSWVRSRSTGLFRSATRSIRTSSLRSMPPPSLGVFSACDTRFATLSRQRPCVRRWSSRRRPSGGSARPSSTQRVTGSRRSMRRRATRPPPSCAPRPTGRSASTSPKPRRAPPSLPPRPRLLRSSASQRRCGRRAVRTPSRCGWRSSISALSVRWPSTPTHSWCLRMRPTPQAWSRPPSLSSTASARPPRACTRAYIRRVLRAQVQRASAAATSAMRSLPAPSRVVLCELDRTGERLRAGRARPWAQAVASGRTSTTGRAERVRACVYAFPFQNWERERFSFMKHALAARRSRLWTRTWLSLLTARATIARSHGRRRALVVEHACGGRRACAGRARADAHPLL